jgi:hypothetical protein
MSTDHVGQINKEVYLATQVSVRKETGYFITVEDIGNKYNGSL